MTGRADSAPGLRIPELGPSLGRMVIPSPESPAAARSHGIPLDDIRYELVTALFELAAEAREWSTGADRDMAVAALNRAAWLHAWERAVSVAAERVAARVDQALQQAAWEVRMPRRRARFLVLSPGERRAIAGRLGAGGGPLLASLDALEETIQPLRTTAAPSPAAQEAWQRALTTAARRLEAAWLVLEEAAAREWRDWSAEVAKVRTWRRPLWPIAVASVVILSVATWMGLVFGGYLAAPQFFQGIAEAWWQRLAI